MASNFDFLKEIDKELFKDIEDAQKLFRDEYFNQAMVQIRVFGEKMAKRFAENKLNNTNQISSSNQSITFDDILNCLKDRIKTERDKEFVDDLFFIKREGNKCAHGEDIEPSIALEALRRAHEASISYCIAKTVEKLSENNKKDLNSEATNKSNKDFEQKVLNQCKKFDKLHFDETLLITGKPLKENTLVQKYVELAQKSADKIEHQTEQNDIYETIAPKKTKKINPAKQKVKQKIKEAKKNLKENVNNDKKPSLPKKSKKTKSKNKQKKSAIVRLVLFAIFVLFSLLILAQFLM